LQRLCNHRLHFRITSGSRWIFEMALIPRICACMILDIFKGRAALADSNMFDNIGLGDIFAETYRRRRIHVHTSTLFCLYFFCCCRFTFFLYFSTLSNFLCMYPLATKLFGCKSEELCCPARANGVSRGGGSNNWYDHFIVEY